MNCFPMYFVMSFPFISIISYPKFFFIVFYGHLNARAEKRETIAFIDYTFFEALYQFGEIVRKKTL